MRVGTTASATTSPVATPVARMTPWPEADALFRGHPNWTGGDSAYSVVLADGSRTWLFADSFITDDPDKAASVARRGTTLVNSCVGRQRGDDPTTATLEVQPARDADGLPRAAFPSPVPGRYVWNGQPVAVGDRLLVFFMVVENVPDAARTDTLDGFRLAGWHARLVDNPADHPSDWVQHDLDLPDLPGLHVLGIGGSWVEDGWLHLHAAARPAGETIPPGDLTGPMHVGRVRVEDVERGDLHATTWWCGDEHGWLPPEAAAGRMVDSDLWPMTEFTVHFDPVADAYVAVQLLSHRGRDAVIGISRASRVQGPWSAFEPLHDVEASTDGTAIAYGAKAHPGLGRDGSVLVTYNTNARRPDDIYDRPDLYLPHCLELSFATP